MSHTIFINSSGFPLYQTESKLLTPQTTFSKISLPASPVCFFFLPSMGYPLLETCFYPHVSWVTCCSLCLENMETIFLPSTFFIIIHASVEMWPQLSTQSKDGHSQLTLITFTLLSYFPHKKHKHLKLQHGCLLAHCPLSNCHLQKKISIRTVGLSLVYTVMALVSKTDPGPEQNANIYWMNKLLCFWSICISRYLITLSGKE